MSNDVIIIVARKRADGFFTYVTVTGAPSGYATGNNPPRGGGGSAGDQPGPGETPPVFQPGDIVINVDVDDPANLEAAIAVAQQISQILHAWKGTLEGSFPNQSVSVAGLVLTVESALGVINSAQWVITDRVYDAENGGVGASVVFPDGTATNYLNFRAFVSGAPRSYDAPGYPNQEGLLFIMMHEIAHLSGVGNSFRIGNEAAWSRQNHDNPGARYEASLYFENVERFSNDSARAMMELLLPFGVGTFVNPRYGYGAVPVGRVGRQ